MRPVRIMCKIRLEGWGSVFWDVASNGGREEAERKEWSLAWRPVLCVFQFLLPFLMLFLEMWIDALTVPFSRFCLETIERSWNFFRGPGIFFVYVQRDKNSATHSNLKPTRESNRLDIRDTQKCKTVYSSC